MTVLTACSGGGGGGGGQRDPDPTPINVNGGGVKGPLANAIVTVYLLDYSVTDFKGSIVDTGTTGDDAAITDLSFVPVDNTPYLIEFTSDAGGMPPTTDLTTGQAPVFTALRTVVDASQLTSLLYGTPLTTAAVDLAIIKADSNASPYSGDNNGVVTEEEFLAALEIAKAQVLSVFGFGLDSSTDIFLASPIINADTTDAASQTLVAQYRTAIEAMTAVIFEMATTAVVAADEMFDAVIADLADDGEINGSQGALITAAEIADLQNPDPGALLIPNTSIPVNDVETVLTDERTDTGNGGVDTSPMQPVNPTPAEPAANIDGDAHPDSSDNCPTVANDDQADVNANGIGDACEPLIAVPNVVGSSQSDAEAAIVAASLVVGSVNFENHTSIAAGNVISQNPASGDVLSGTVIDLVVSLGPVMVDVPDVVDTPQASAESAIVDAGLTVGDVTTANSNTIVAGNVISQDPSGGQAPEGSAVDLVISIGPPTGDVPPISGIWRLQPTGFVSNGCDAVTPGNTSPEYLLTFTDLVQYVSIEQPDGGNAITVRFPNGIVATGSINGDDSIQFTGERSWQTNRGESANVSYDVSGTYVTGAPNTLDLTIVDEPFIGLSACSQNISYTAEHVYNPTGAEDYNGTYTLEGIQKFSNWPGTDRESTVYDIGINGANGTLAFVEDDGIMYHLPMTATFDPATGFATLMNVEDIVRDHDGDGLEDDLEHVEVQAFILYVRSDTDPSTAPTIAITWYESTSVFLDTVVYPGAGNGTPIEHDDDYSFGYAKLVQPTGFTVSSYEPVINTPNEQELVRLGIHHPPLLALDPEATNTFEIVSAAGGDPVCNGDYPNRYRLRIFFPNHVNDVDMSQEQFWPYSYSNMNCSVAPGAVDGEYVMNIRDSGGQLQYSVPITAEPTTFASALPNRRAIDVNGAVSSQTRRGDSIRLHGFFNASFGHTLPIVVPASTDPDIDYYRLRFTNNTVYPNFVGDFHSNSNTFVIPGDTVFDSENGVNFDLQVIERYLRPDGRRAQSVSRKLRMQAGIRALVNLEMYNATLDQTTTWQLWLSGSNEYYEDTYCLVTKPLDSGLTCAGTINFNTNTISISDSSIGLGTFMSITFTDSVSGSAIFYDAINGNWTGTARVVNPELVVRSEIDHNNNARTAIIYSNPLAPTSSGATGGTGILSSLSGQNIGNGAGMNRTIWNNNYSSVYNSFMQTPFDDLLPQSTGAYRAVHTGAVGLLTADTITLTENGRTFRATYDGASPANFTPPSQSDIWINFGGADQPGTGYTYDLRPQIAAQPVTLIWNHTPNADPADTRWQIRLRQVLTSENDHVSHSETRTQRLADGEGGLSYNPATMQWSWTVSPEFQIPEGDGIWKFNIRVTNANNSIRGNSQGVVMTNPVTP